MELPNLKKHFIEKGGLSEKDYASIQSYIQTKKVSKNDFLLKQGAICSHFFFVEQGLLRMYALNEEGKENILQFATEGWIVSDRGSVFFQEPSTYFIDAVEDLEFFLGNTSSGKGNKIVVFFSTAMLESV